MAKGRKKKPPELEALQGFPGRRKAQTVSILEAAAAAEEGGGQMPAPPWLTSDAAVIWDSFVTDPALKFTFKRSDTAELARYCDNLARYLALHRSVGTKISYSAKNAAGSRRRYIKPEYRELVALGKELRNQAGTLGLNPQARLSVAAKLAAPIAPNTPSKKQPGNAAKVSGPLGVLKASQKIDFSQPN